MPTIELNFVSGIKARLRRYIDSVGLTGGTERTDHWASLGARNRISFNLSGSRVELVGGIGFDDCYALNFEPFGLEGEVRRRWAYWRSRHVSRRFLDAFRATLADGDMGVEDFSNALGPPNTSHKPLAAFYYNRVCPHLKKVTNFRYLEIGAGTGYLTALFHAKHRCKVLIVDLPEIIPFSFLYLSKRFPKAIFQLPNEISKPAGISDTADFVFLRPDQIDLILDESVDLAVNTASFGEMLPGQVDTYFCLLRRTLGAGGLFFTSNRVEKWMRAPGSPEDHSVQARGVAIKFLDYPWSRGDRDILFRSSEFHDLVQPASPFLMRLVELARAK